MSTVLQPVERAASQKPIQSDIPGRLDRLPWSRFHWLLVIALGVTWVLDGLEGTVVGAVIPVLKDPQTLHLSGKQVGFTGSLYIIGLIVGALVFGYLTDALGRKKLFTVTLAIYLAGATLTALAWDFWSLLLFRFITGLAIGGEYSAINSAIDELIPARLRGRVDLAINSTFWLGAILGALVTLLLLSSIPKDLAWRFAFGLGALVGGAMILARRYVPESPRWLVSHGRTDEAEKIMTGIERHVADRGTLAPVSHRINILPAGKISFGRVAHTLFGKYRSRALLGLVLIAAQALFYNGVFFTFPLLLSDQFKVSDQRIPAYVICMATANLLGPMLLGRLFDTVGRRKMIALTYSLAGLGILTTQMLFLHTQLLQPAGDTAEVMKLNELGLVDSLKLLVATGTLTAETQTMLWMIAFFFASAAASAGYLTVSEIFPVEMRGLAIALFFALGTTVAAVGPELFTWINESGNRLLFFAGYAGAALIMVAAAAVEWWFGVDTEGKSLEDVASPLSSV
jgi:MFS family permease